MGKSTLEDYVAYQKALVLFDAVRDDIANWLTDPTLVRLAAQQISSADSVCSNIEEGYGRESRAEFCRFLSYARGSLRETRGRYLRLRHWIPEHVVEERVALADEISRMLSASLTTLRKHPAE